MKTTFCKYCGKEFTLKYNSIKQTYCSYSCSVRDRYDDLTGKKFNRLYVKECIGSDERGKRLWKCKCDCGNEIITNSYALTHNHTMSCGCYNKEIVSTIRKKDRGVASFNALYANYVMNAKKRGHVFELSKEQFKELTSSNCFYCGAIPQNGNYVNQQKNGNYIYNGIDRVDNNKGYIIDNVVSCCTICNKMKHALSQNYFIDHIQKIIDNLKSNTNLIERE